MIIGRVHKDNPVILIILFLIIFLSFTAGIILVFIFLDIKWLKILLISVFALICLISLSIPFYIYKSSKTPNDIIYYDYAKNSFRIYDYKKEKEIMIDDILGITIHNSFITILSIFNMDRTNYGKIYFYLSDGRIIKTPQLDKVLDTCDKIDEIVFKDREYKEEIQDSLLEKMDGWGAKKEYPSIVSALVGIFLPIIGMLFVMNQVKIKEIKYGRPTGLITVGVVASAFWILTFIIILYIFI